MSTPIRDSIETQTRAAVLRAQTRLWMRAHRMLPKPAMVLTFGDVSPETIGELTASWGK